MAGDFGPSLNIRFEDRSILVAPLLTYLAAYFVISGKLPRDVLSEEAIMIRQAYTISVEERSIEPSFEDARIQVSFNNPSITINSLLEQSLSAIERDRWPLVVGCMYNFTNEEFACQLARSASRISILVDESKAFDSSGRRANIGLLKCAISLAENNGLIDGVSPIRMVTTRREEDQQYPGYMHHKFLVLCDQNEDGNAKPRFTITGSYNPSFTSLGREALMLIEGQEVSRSFYREFDSLFDISIPIGRFTGTESETFLGISQLARQQNVSGYDRLRVAEKSRITRYSTAYNSPREIGKAVRLLIEITKTELEQPSWLQLGDPENYNQVTNLIKAVISV